MSTPEDRERLRSAMIRAGEPPEVIAQAIDGLDDVLTVDQLRERLSPAYDADELETAIMAVLDRGVSLPSAPGNEPRFTREDVSAVHDEVIARAVERQRNSPELARVFEAFGDFMDARQSDDVAATDQAKSALDEAVTAALRGGWAVGDISRACGYSTADIERLRP